jgi:hypothetical protein
MSRTETIFFLNGVLYGDMLYKNMLYKDKLSEDMFYKDMLCKDMLTKTSCTRTWPTRTYFTSAIQRPKKVACVPWLCVSPSNALSSDPSYYTTTLVKLSLSWCLLYCSHVKQGRLARYFLFTAIFYVSSKSYKTEQSTFYRNWDRW